MRTGITASVGLIFLVGITAASFGVGAPETTLPNFDKRGTVGAAQAVSAQQQAAAAALGAALSGAEVAFDPVTGGPKWVSAREKFLTGPGGAGLTVSAATAASYAGDAYGPTKAFLRDQSNLFGFGPEALGSAVKTREFTGAHNGLTTVVWQQQLSGIPIFEAVLISHTSKDQALVSIASQFVVDASGAADAGFSGWTAKIGTPDISAAQAVGVAARNVGEATQDGAPQAAQSLTAPEGTDPQQSQQLTADGIKGSAQAKLVWLPVGKDRLRLCWEIIFTSRTRGEMFLVLVDAQSGEAWLRHCLTDYISPASYRVFTSDSPSPFSPGYATPVTNQPPLVARTLVTIDALDTNASPSGWIDDGGNETRGNNVDAHTDRNADNVPDLPRPQGSPSRVFDFAMDLSSQDPTNYGNAAVVQLFYLCNWYHDRLYQLGFTEAAGNFQSNNFGRGGLGNDAVQADAQDGSGFNNANFSTPPDGQPGRMQMYIFTGPSPRRDGDLDAEIVLHEHTHGLSNRRVGGGVGISALQSQGMGEGWSDFYALTLLSEPGDDVNGNYAAGAYGSYKIGGPTDLQNYYFGIRRYPYTTDMSKNPLTFKDLDPAQAAYCSSPAPYHTGMFGSCSTANSAEVHNQGELWCVTLWDARARLVTKYGYAVGNQLILQLVTDGMNLSPVNPNFLQARDAILQADVVDNGGANLTELWGAFAKRGMGFSATSPSSSTTTGVHEAFDAPDDLRITPATGFVSRGPVGGPFIPSAQTFVLTNAGSNVFSWTLVNTSSWLNFSASSGTLNPAGPSVSVTGSVGAAASGLPMGVYPATVWFSNLTSHARQSRQFSLRVGQPDYYTELFDSSPNDTAFQTWTFTPDGSASFYSVCRQGAGSFPTDPSGGTTVVLSDDSFVQATLSGTNNTVAIYNKRTNVFFIGSNGYLTMNSGDSAYIESYTNHFNRPRVAGLYHDLNPSLGGTISWKQLADRAAVTFQGVPEYGNSSQTNSFQIELFFDGRIRLTCLSIRTVSGLVGLSAGLGVPANFDKSDLTSYGPCAPLTVLLPSSAIEGAGTLANAGAVWLASVLPTNLVVALTSSLPSKLVVPASVTINAGLLFNTFDLNVPDNGVHDGDQIVTVTAAAAGFTNISSSIVIIDDDTPPVIVSQPASVVATVGGSASFSVGVTGKTPLSYFWRRNGGPIAGATASSYSTNNVQVADSGSQFSCFVSNALGSVLSSNAVLTVVTGLVDVITFDDLAAGGGIPIPLGYHTLSNWNNFYVLNAPLYQTNSGYFAGMVSSPNVAYNAYGDPAILSSPTPFTLSSAYLTAAWNDNLQLEVRGYVGGALVYDNSYVLSATSPTLINFGYANVSRVDFIASGGTPHPGYPGSGTHFAMDNLVVTTQPQPPIIISQPVNQTAVAGGSATFSVTAAGSQPLSYFWRRNGSFIGGATGSSYTTNNVQLADSGSVFSCLVSNSVGTTNSQGATLTVLPPGSGGGVAYVRSTIGPPWGVLDNEGILTMVFGANWQDLRYETVNPGTLFSANNGFIWLEGGADNGPAMGNFLTNNLPAISNWVASGGSLFLNAAPYFGGTYYMSFGFGVTLTVGDSSDTAGAANPAHAIFNGPYLPVGGSFSGNYFGHSTVSGSGLAGLLTNTANGNFVLAEKGYGTGHLLMGGMTAPSFHSPQPQSTNLLANILKYGSSLSQSSVSNILVFWGVDTGSSAFATALTNLGKPFQLFTGSQYSSFIVAVSNASPGNSLVIVDTPSASGDFGSVVTFVNAGGRAIMDYWYLEGYPTLAAAFQATTIADFTTPLPVYDWGGSTLFNGVSSPLGFADPWGIDGDRLQPSGGAQSFAGFVSSPAANQAAIVFGNSGRTLLNGFLFAEVSPVAAGVQLARNEIQLVIGGGSTSSPPVITLQPVSQTVLVGGSASFTVSASGSAPLSYFWKRNGGPIAGATGTSYTTNNVQLADSGAQFSCLVSNAVGTANSAAATLTVTPVGSSGSAAYVRSTIGQPWGRADNEGILTMVFGINWQDLRYETVSSAALLSPTNRFIFLEGSDNNATALSAFLATNLPAISNWVTAGGSLFLNAAPNTGGNIYCGFGVTLTYPDYTHGNAAVNAGHPIFNGPFLPVGTGFNGNAFGHATVSGGGVTALLTNVDANHVVLAEGAYGGGHVIFGGMTLPFYHSPQPQGTNLLANILAYGASLGAVQPTPTVGIAFPSSSPGGSTNEYSALYSTLTNLGFPVVTVANGQWAGIKVVVSYPGNDPVGFGPTLPQISNGVSFVDISDWGFAWTPNSWSSVTEGANLTLSLGAAHPITAGLPASWIAHGFWRYGAVGNNYVGWSTDPALPSLASETAVVSQSRVLVANSLGSGRAVYVGWNVYGPNAGPNDLAVLRNAILWAAGASVGPVAPTIVQQPVSQTTTVGGSATFSVTAAGTAPLSYYWKRNGGLIAGATGTSYTTNNVQLADSGTQFSCLVSNAVGTANSAAATLTVTPGGTTVTNILVFNDSGSPSPFAAALTNLGMTFQSFGAGQYANFATALAGATPSATLAIVDVPSNQYDFMNLITFVNAGGRSVVDYWSLDTLPSLATAFQVTTTSNLFSPVPVYDWGGSTLFSGLSSPLSFTDRAGDDGDMLQPNGGAQGVAGFTASPTTNRAAIVLGNSGRTLINGFLFWDITAPADAVQLAQNEIRLLTTNLAGTTIVTDTNVWDGSYSICCFGEPDTATYGQIFVPPPQSSVLTSFTIYINNQQNSVNFKFYVMRWDGSKATGPILFQSAATSTAGQVGWHPYSFNTGQLSLTPGVAYVAFACTSTLQDGGTSAASMGAPIVDAYTNGYFVYFNNGNNFSLLTNAPWLSFPSLDLAFVAVFGGGVVAGPPSIVTQPAGQTISAGGSASFSVTASGTAPLAYQWRKDGYNIGGATASSYGIPFAMPFDSGNYSVRVTNGYGSVTSAAAPLVVLGPGNDACTNATEISGVNYTNTQSTLGAASTGDSLPTCGSGFGSGVWYKYTAPLNGKIDVDTIGSDFDTILAVYSGGCGSLVQVSCDDDGGGGVTSRTSANVAAGVPCYILAGGYGGAVGNLVLHLTFSAAGTAPVIFTQPASQTKAIGDTATFSVSLAGSLPLSYQWRQGGAGIAGATGSTYTIGSVLPASAGSYSVLVTNQFGSALSSNALLTVVAGPALAFLADFESGNNGFSYLPDPDAISNLWHRTTHRFVSTNHSQYYGREGVWTYDTGARNAGNLQSGPISLVGAVAPISLSFNYLLQTEALTNYDQATLSISSDGGTNWVTLATRASANRLSSSTNGTVFTAWIGDISSYAGRTVLLRFNFDTIDGAVNDFEGWYVDDVAITAASFQPAFRLRPNVLANRALELWITRQDAVALTVGDAARMHIYFCTNLTSPTWQEITNSMSVTNGLIRVDGLSCTNAVRQYFRAMQTP